MPCPVEKLKEEMEVLAAISHSWCKEKKAQIRSVWKTFQRGSREKSQAVRRRRVEEAKDNPQVHPAFNPGEGEVHDTT